jgi:hypothetical protein
LQLLHDLPQVRQFVIGPLVDDGGRRDGAGAVVLADARQLRRRQRQQPGNMPRPAFGQLRQQLRQ